MGLAKPLVRDIRHLWRNGTRFRMPFILAAAAVNPKRAFNLKVGSRHLWIRLGTPDLKVATASLSGEFKPAIEAAMPLRHHLIIDAGGYIGTAAIAFAEAYPNALVVTLEPSRENFAVLQRNVRGYPNIIAINKALAASEHRISLVNRGTGTWGFSVIETPDDCPSPQHLHEVDTTTIPMLLKEFRADGIDILKLDIEGSEYALLRDNPNWINSVRVIFAELHNRIVPGCTRVFAEATRGRRPMIRKGEKVLSVAAGVMRSAVLMITHSDDARLLAHFDRLKREAGIPAFLVHHVGVAKSKPSAADICISDRDIQTAFPVRNKQMTKLRRAINKGYVDTVSITAAMHRRFSAFDFVWVIEGDVDYAGNWSEFFALYADNPSDVLACRIRCREQDPEWYNWRWLQIPPNVQPYSAFIPAARFSRHFIETYTREMQRPEWSGHSEAMIASVAFAHGMRVEDIYGTGDFPADQPRAPLDWETFGFRPVRSTSFYHEAPENFPKVNMLYHPVKPV